MGQTFVKDVMKKDIISIDSAKTVKDAAVLMDGTNVGSVIITEQNVPIGILTERDFVKRIVAQEKPVSTPLSDVMSSPLIVIDPELTVWEAAEVMKTKEIHKLPAQTGNKIVGMITTSDLVRICSIGSDSELRRICDQILLRMSPNQPD